MSIESSAPFNPDEARQRALEDGSGRSAFEARAYIDPDSEGLTGTSETPLFARPKHRQRPTGKPAVEMSGRDAGRILANIDADLNPVDTEIQAEINKRGAALARAAIKPVLHGRAVQRAIEGTPVDSDRPEVGARDIKLAVNAAQQTFFDKHPS